MRKERNAFLELWQREKERERERISVFPRISFVFVSPGDDFVRGGESLHFSFRGRRRWKKVDFAAAAAAATGDSLFAAGTGGIIFLLLLFFVDNDFCKQVSFSRLPWAFVAMVLNLLSRTLYWLSPPVVLS